MTERLGINLLWLVPGVVGGSEEYATRTLTALLDRDIAGIELTVFALDSFARTHPEVCARVETVTTPLGGGENRLRRVIGESTWLAAQCRRRSIDAVHHVGGRMPTIRPGRTIVTVHDLQPLIMPANFGSLKARYLRFAIPRSVRSADMVVAPSDYVRADLIRRFDLDPARVATVSAGYEVPRLPAIDDPVVPTEIAELLRKGQPFFVYPAVTHPHKNHATVLRAFAKVVIDDPDVTLVFTGGRGSAHADVLSLVTELGLNDHVHRFGRVDREVLDLLIARAEALVFPSEFEGFGIPILEAMALGCPVLAADATAVPEVLGNAGILVPPGDVDAWVRAMSDRLAGRPNREAAAAAGRAQAARFAWEQSGTQLEGVYRTVLAR